MKFSSLTSADALADDYRYVIRFGRNVTRVPNVETRARSQDAARVMLESLFKAFGGHVGGSVYDNEKKKLVYSAERMETLGSIKYSLGDKG